MRWTEVEIDALEFVLNDYTEMIQGIVLGETKKFNMPLEEFVLVIKGILETSNEAQTVSTDIEMAYSAMENFLVVYDQWLVMREEGV